MILEENILFSTQFIKNISKNLPSVIGNDYRSIPLTTTLDEKARPATIEYNECVFTFEYFE